MTEQTEGTSAELQAEIEDLDREAREALDRLADKREELARQHQATELAEGRRREREAERRREAEREREERERRRREEETRRLGARRLALEERAEKEAAALSSTMKELLELDPVHRRAVEACVGRGKAPEQLFYRTFAQELQDWFNGRFKGVVPGLGGDLREGLALPDRDALTPARAGMGPEEGAAR